MPSSLWNPAYSGKLRLRSFSISSMASDSRPSNLARMSVYKFGCCNLRNRDPDVSSHSSPRSRFGRPTRRSRVNVGCLMSVRFRPLSSQRLDRGNLRMVDVQQPTSQILSPQSHLALVSQFLRIPREAKQQAEANIGRILPGCIRLLPVFVSLVGEEVFGVAL